MNWETDSSYFWLCKEHSLNLAQHTGCVGLTGRRLILFQGGYADWLKDAFDYIQFS